MARRALPDLPHIAVFDTAFFHVLPPAAATYAIDRDIAQQWHINRSIGGDAKPAVRKS